MTSQAEKARLFRSLHVPFDPVVIYNIWDAGSAAAVARAGAKVLATSSWSVAAAQGYADGEALSLDDVLAVVERIAASVDLPVSVDFEGGYAADPKTIGRNTQRLLELGVVGLNFEDRIVKGPGLFSVVDQAARLRAVRHAADASGVPAFVNARTDVFLEAPPGADPNDLIHDAIARCAAYAEAGADGFFVPGLTDGTLIEQMCEASSLPVNVMLPDNLAGFRAAAARGVSRISFGPAPYINLYAALERDAHGYF